MQKEFLLILICVLFFKLSSQTIEPDLDYYTSGELRWKGQKYCFMEKDEKICKPIGLKTYWYKNGQKKLMTYDTIYKNNYTPPTRYINMWQQDEMQILKNGIGFYFEKENHGGGEWDSLTYQVKDSVWNGSFSRNRKHNGSKYYLVESGQFSDSKKYGVFKFRDTVQLYEEETLYDTKETSDYKYFYPTLKIKEEGKTLNAKKEGLSKFYNDKGTLIKEVNYKSGAEFGEYKEYYDSGVIKTQGQYKQIKGFVNTSTFDPQGIEHIRKHPDDHIPQKTGEWKYYDEKGNLIKTETLK
jgi:antitoxin component YwqK of YwqJK toxin-antitoxin module